MQSLIKSIRDIFVSNKLKLSVAESLTSGNLQAAISSISGASDFYEGGVTAYSIDQKVNLLGVDRLTAEKVDCVSQDVADQMALGVSRLFKTDYGISTTGYADGEQYAFYSICLDGKIVDSGKLVGESLSRTSMQKYVTLEVLTRLNGYKLSTS